MKTNSLKIHASILNSVKRVRFISTVMLTGVMLSACGSDTSESSDTNTVPTPDTTEQGWQLVWSDEFDGSELDTTKWNYAFDCYGGGNNEGQCYTDRADNSQVADGLLTITAKRETFSGPAFVKTDPNYDASDTSKTLDYTSARLDSMHKGDWKYGRFEIRAKMPFGQGTWPAIWMLPTDWAYGPWAGSGEIDIMEAVNLKVVTDGSEPESALHGTLHYGKAWPGNVYSGQEYHLPDGANPADDFHVYALEWQEDEIRWYVDDVHYATQRATGWYSQYVDEDGNLQSAPNDAPFNQSFHMILNFAVGGAWAGQVNNTGIDETVFPQTMQVDYVRVYECATSPATGAGCETIDDTATVVEGHSAPEIIIPDDNFGSGPFFSLFDDQLAQGLAFNSYNPDGQISYQLESVAERGEVLTIDKTGSVGNVYFEYPPKADLSHWGPNGQLIFDLLIESKDDATELLVKIDSGWPNVSDMNVDLPTTGEWQQVTISIAELIAKGNRFSPGSFANIASVQNLLVIEPLGKMKLQLDNIRFEYSVSAQTEVLVYDDAVAAPFTLGYYAASGELLINQQDVGGEHKMVTEFVFNTNEAVGYFQSTGITHDVSDFSHLSFDVNVVQDSRTNRNLMIKMDCVHPCSTGDYPLEVPDVGVWTHYQIPLTSLTTHPGSSLDLTKVESPLVIFPSWGDQQGVIVQVDNVKIH